MKFTVKQNALLKPLQQVVSVVGRNKHQLILSNVLLAVNDNTLTMTCTDLEIEATATIKLDGSAVDGAITVPAKQLLSIVKQIGTSDCHVSYDTETLLIASGECRFNLPTLPAFDFPSAITHSDKVTEFAMSCKDLKNLIGKTKHAMADMDVRYYLNGALLDINTERLKLVATDGRRVAIAEILRTSTETAQVIIPRDTIKTLHHTLDGIGVTVEIFKNAIRFMTDTLTIQSKIIDGRYPDYERVIPSEPVGAWTFNTKGLLAVLTRMKALSKDKYSTVIIESTGSLCTITSKHGQSNVEIDWSGDPVAQCRIELNVIYLLETLKTISGDTVTIDYTSTKDAVRIVDGSQTHVIMPIRL